MFHLLKSITLFAGKQAGLIYYYGILKVNKSYGKLYQMNKLISLIGIQSLAGIDKNVNLQMALDLIDEALSLYNQADVIVLPECFYEIIGKKTMGVYPEEIKEALAERAAKYGAYIVGGSVLNRQRPDEKLRNTALLYGRNGEILGSYDKIHLFDALNCADKDKESHYCEHGTRTFTYDADFGKIGIMICYDIRFPELARTLALKGVKFLFVPSAFYSPRTDHWEALLKGIAIQNSIYVMGVNLFGKLTEGSGFCGRSMLIDPWGVIIAGASDKACFFQAYVDPDYPAQIGSSVGSFINRRPSIYDIY
jgi:predicted amidohydrolase